MITSIELARYLNVMRADKAWRIRRRNTVEHYQDELLEFSDFEFDDEVEDAFEL